MAPTLQRIILNGASRHRLSKGFILVSDGHSAVDVGRRDQIVQVVNQALAAQPDLAGFSVEARPTHVSLIGLTTPFLPVYDVAHRDAFIARLATVTGILSQAASRAGCSLTAAGVNPFVADADSQVPALCADLHQIEVFDDGEIERVYNLYRQFLPELLAISTHAAVYGGALQKDFSLRMRVNPASFLPRYLSQFSAQHLDKLRGMMRKDYGLADLRQMDINPLAGDSEKLMQDASPLSPTPAAVELRFVDSQATYPFIRAQIIIFQAIAMYGRALAREGKRLPYMRDEVIDENKALAVQSGPGAILKPDEKFKKGDSGRGFLFHDKGTPERATTSLLMIIDGLLLPYLRELRCQYWELAPILLGAELRRRGRQCFANYAEYQKYLYYTHSAQFAAVSRQQVRQLLTSPRLDYVTEYNQRIYSDLVSKIEHEWTEKLQPRPRHKGQVKWYSVQKGYGFIRSEQGEEFHVQQNNIEGTDRLEDGQPVSFEILERGRRPLAVRVRVEIQERYTGYVARFDEAKGFGFITVQGQGDVYVHRSDVVDGQSLTAGDVVSFEIIQETKGPRAVRVKIQEQPRQRGWVKWFDRKRRFGYITPADGQDIFVHQDDLEGVSALKPKQKVSFEIGQSPKGPKAIRVRVEDKE